MLGKGQGRETPSPSAGRGLWSTKQLIREKRDRGEGWTLPAAAAAKWEVCLNAVRGEGRVLLCVNPAFQGGAKSDAWTGCEARSHVQLQ